MFDPSWPLLSPALRNKYKTPHARRVFGRTVRVMMRHRFTKEQAREFAHAILTFRFSPHLNEGKYNRLGRIK
jgi:hypothetical protein